MRRLGLVMVASCLAVTAGLWFLAQGLEEKVLGSIQPHLATDVRIGNVDLTVWSSWPDVEVVLEQVWVEDALDPDEGFLELQEVGVVFGWMPLLQGSLEVDRIKARGGLVRIERSRGGASNWQFWKSEGQGGNELDWGIAELELEDVRLEGSWWAGDADHPVEWSTLCRALRLGSLDGSFADDAWTVRGRVLLEDAELRASGQTWLEGASLNAGLEGEWLGNHLDVRFEDALLDGGAGSVPLEGTISGGEDFAMELRSGISKAEVLLEAVPRFIVRQWDPEWKVSGPLVAEVRVGRGSVDSDVAMPVDADWTGEWAVALEPRTMEVTRDKWAVGLSGGRVDIHPVTGGWRADFHGMSGALSGGEYRCSGRWSSVRGADRLDTDLEWVVRPALLLESWDGGDLLPAGWRCLDGGSFKGKGHIALQHAEGDWTWNGGAVAVELADLRLGAGSNEFGLASARGDVSVDGGMLEIAGLKGPGLSGGAGGSIRWTDTERFDVGMRVAALDVEPLMAALEGGDSPGQDGARGVMAWNAEIDVLRWGKTRAEGLKAEGEWDLSRSKGTIFDFGAALFDGRCSGRGGWSPEGILLDGRLADVSMPMLLEGTDGLGQKILMPSHVRGRAWADGVLGYDFKAVEGLEWSTDLEVRIEQGELVDFELLQRIPETLKEEPQYRLISDAQDLGRRLRRVRFEPVTAHITMEMGLITLDQTEIVSDAMDVGIGGWQRLSGSMEYTLDFALRDLKADREEFGSTEDDGLGHRFFLAIGGTLDAPEFGYDRMAHKAHRQGERREALDRLKGLIRGEEAGETREMSEDQQGVVLAETPQPIPDESKRKKKELEDDDDDFAP